MKRIITTRAILILLTIFMAFSLYSCGDDTDEGELYLEVESITSDGNSKFITLEYENDAGNKITFGWVNSCEVLVTTNQGTYSQTMISLSNTIKQGNGTIELYIDDCPGTVEKIEITELCLLNDRGLPDVREHDIVIYDDNEDTDSCNVSFGMNNQQAAVLGIFTVFGLSGAIVLGCAALIIVAIIAVIIVVVLLVKKNKKNKTVFQPYTGNSGDTNDTSNNQLDGFVPPPDNN